jgi:UDP-2-acetamido-3-amino-2,3-dideoxy-glucuronate N-acetyltransferase
MIGMGSLVTRSIPEFHLALGSPARSVGCVCRCGQLLMRFPEETVSQTVELACASCGLPYVLRDRVVTEMSPPVVT